MCIRDRFVHKRSHKLIERWNLQSSPDNIISDKPGRVGDIPESPGLEGFQAVDNVGLKQGRICCRCVFSVSLRKSRCMENFVRTGNGPRFERKEKALALTPRGRGHVDTWALKLRHR